MAGAFFIGAPVVICATGEFYQYIDGWKGTVIDYQGGNNKVLCVNPDGRPVEFLVPDGELRKYHD